MYVLMGIVILIPIFTLWGLFSSDQYTPMSYDEEYKWLTETCGLSHEEAEEYCNMRTPK